jgi:hypothetical protein
MIHVQKGRELLTLPHKFFSDLILQKVHGLNGVSKGEPVEVHDNWEPYVHVLGNPLGHEGVVVGFLSVFAEDLDSPGITG